MPKWSGSSVTLPSGQAARLLSLTSLFGLDYADVFIPAVLREKYSLKPGSVVQVVDYGGVLALVPAFKDPIAEGAD